MNHILIVADRKTTIDSLQESLDPRRFRFLVAGNQRNALRLARQTAPDLIIVDSTSGRMSGAKICATLRRVLDAPLVVIVRAPSEAEAVGATDCLVKPYTARQLAASVHRALLYPRALTFGALTLDLRTRAVSVPHLREPQILTPKLFSLMRMLMRYQGAVASREALMAEVWHTDPFPDSRTLDVHIHWIREIIEPDQSNPTYLRTMRGAGYYLTMGQEEALLAMGEERYHSVPVAAV